MLPWKKYGTKSRYFIQILKWTVCLGKMNFFCLNYLSQILFADIENRKQNNIQTYVYSVYKNCLFKRNAWQSKITVMQSLE